MGKLVVGIEDEPHIVELLRVTMEANSDIRFLAADTGKAGLDLCRSELPDLVLLDMRLPDMDGLTVCRELKQDPKTASIQVMVLTGMTQDDDVQNGRQAGADDVLFKPFSPLALQAVVSKRLATRTRSQQRSSASAGGRDAEAHWLRPGHGLGMAQR